jgi:hypothetical protein
VTDLHAPHDCPDNVPLAKPIKMVEPLLGFSREVLQVTDQKGQVVLGLGSFKHGLALLLEHRPQKSEPVLSEKMIKNKSLQHRT